MPSEPLEGWSSSPSNNFEASENQRFRTDLIHDDEYLTDTLRNQEVPSPHKQVALAQRLKCYPSTINRNRNKPNFKKWTQERDPDGWGWVYRYGLYYPIEKANPYP